MIRLMVTCLGTTYLYIPKLRKFNYVFFIVTETKRSGLALVSLIQEAFINGASTRQIERLAKALGVEDISASQVSEVHKEFGAQVEHFRSRPLEEEYPFLWIDILYEKVRVEDRVVTLALMIPHAVNSSAAREILAIEPMFDESEDSWRAFFRKLKARGLQRVGLFVSDAHVGIQAAVKKELLGTSWQRCKVHFMRNILAKVPSREKAGARGPSEAKLAPAGQGERQAYGGAGRPGIRGPLPRGHPLSRRRLGGLSPVLQYSRNRSKEDLLDGHVRAHDPRGQVTQSRGRNLPPIESWVHMDTCYLMEYSEDWPGDQSYSKKEKNQEVLECNRAFLAA